MEPSLADKDDGRRLSDCAGGRNPRWGGHADPRRAALVIGAAGWHFAAALDAVGFQVVKAPAEARQLTNSAREMLDGVHGARKRGTLIRLSTRHLVI